MRSAGGGAKIHERVAVELQQMWHDELGIDMDLRQVEWKVYLANQSKMAFDVCRASWIGDYNDADTFLNMFMSNNGNNRTGWKNARYDELIRAADRENDLDKREKIFQKAETMLVRDEDPIMPIYYYVGFNYYDPNKIKGIYPNILDSHPLNAIWKETNSRRKCQASASGNLKRRAAARAPSRKLSQPISRHVFPPAHCSCPFPLLLVISFLAFSLMKLAPGGPFDRERKPASPEIERNLMRKYHLDEPFWKQYLRYLGVGYEHDAQGKIHWFQGGLIRGDFGPSQNTAITRSTTSSRRDCRSRCRWACWRLVLRWALGFLLGFSQPSSAASGRIIVGSFLAILAVCVPGLVMGPVLVVVFAMHFRWFPVALWESPLHTMLPMIALGLYFAGRIARLMREGMLNVMQSEFITAARAKGHERNNAAAETRRAHRDIAGRFLFRPDAGGFADRVFRDRKHFPDPRPGHAVREQLR